MPAISVLGRLKQEDYKFEANLDYTARPCLKKKKKITHLPLFSNNLTPSLAFPHLIFLFRCWLA
jgi:hypothetical protein